MVKTVDPHAWFVCVNSSGKKQTVYNNEHYEHNYPFAFECSFSDTATPPVNTVTLYNMSKEHRNFYKKGQKCYLYFNWGTSKKMISEGYISKINKVSSDGTTETFQLTFTEGTDYKTYEARKMKISKTKKVTKYKTKKVKGKNGKSKNKRYKTRQNKTFLVNKTYRKGTSYKTLIKGVANQSGIKISKIDLKKNPKIKKAYVAQGKPLTLLKQLVKKTGSRMTYIRGKLEIVDPTKNHRTWYDIDDKDLIQPPSYTEADNDEDGGTWEIVIPLVPEITTNVGIKMKSKYLKGKYFVKSGQHTNDGENPQTTCSLVKL